MPVQVHAIRTSMILTIIIVLGGVKADMTSQDIDNKTIPSNTENSTITTHAPMKVTKDRNGPTYPTLDAVSDFGDLQMSGTTCTMEFCNCKKENWLELEHRNKTYIKINNAARNYSMSAQICEYLGGQLLTIHDAETESITIKQIDQRHSLGQLLYWVGLSKKNGNWYWIDGTKLVKKSYQNWAPGAPVDYSCGSILWNGHGEWRDVNCSSKNYQICETTEPCSAHLVMYFNQRKRMGSGNINVINDQEAVIYCYFYGYRDVVSELLVMCGGGWVKREYERQNITMKIRVNIQMHKKTCRCQLIYYIGMTKTAFFTIHFKTRPRLVNKDDYNTTFYFSVGEMVLLEINIYANPKPKTGILIKNGAALNLTLYEILMKPLKMDLYYSIKIRIEEFQRNYTGAYILPIENGINKSLEYAFNLQEAFNQPKHSRYLYLILTTALMFLWTSLFIVCRLLNKEREEESKDENVYAKIYANEMCKGSVVPFPSSSSFKKSKKSERSHWDGSGWILKKKTTEMLVAKPDSKELRATKNIPENKRIDWGTPV